MRLRISKGSLTLDTYNIVEYSYGSGRIEKGGRVSASI